MYTNGLKDKFGNKLEEKANLNCKNNFTKDNIFTANVTMSGGVNCNTLNSSEIYATFIDFSDEVDENGVENETFQNEGNIEINFGDAYNGRYFIVNSENLHTDDEDENVRVIDALFNIPEKMETKLVKRYLVIDLRNIEQTTTLVTSFPDDKITWLGETPSIQCGHFYLISFQRFSDDLIIGQQIISL